LKRDCRPVAKRFHSASACAIFFANNAAIRRGRRFATTFVPNGIDRLPDKNRRAECDTQYQRMSENIHYRGMYWGSTPQINETTPSESHATH
jgi:hypothetical protein